MILTVLAYALGTLALLRSFVGVVGLVRFLRQANVRRIAKGPTPPLSLLKPVYGCEDGLEENLVATLRQNYEDFEVLVLHEREDDPALAAVQAASARVPDVSVRTIQGRVDGLANPKVAVLARGQAEARHALIAAADSDVTPDPLYLRDIANGLAVADAVSFVPVLYGATSPAARLMALLVNTDALMAGVQAAGRFTTGATIGVRRDALEAIGGYAAIGDFIADDYALGQALKRAGRSLVLARRTARVRVGAASFRWALRWLRTVRSAAPVAYLAWALFAVTPLALLLAWEPITLAALGTLTLLRAGVAIVIDFRFCWDRSLIRALPWLPALWILEPIGLLAGLFGSTVTWRGRRYRLKRGRAKVVAS